ncbi:MAG TPA: RDD family protein [Candidatus Onthovivens sp.]|nr:RDD family protein [Candidatus Onthovivens sp.]
MENKSIEISYYRARTSQKLGAIILDFLIVSFISLGLFIGAKQIVESTSYYKEMDKEFTALKLASNLYVDLDNKGTIVDIVSFINKQTNLSSSDSEKYLVDHVYSFFAGFEEETSLKLEKEYKDYISDSRRQYKGEPYFLFKGEEVFKNIDAKIPVKEYVENVYKPYVDEIALGRFIIETPRVLDIQKYQSNMLLFVEIPSAVTLGIIITYYLIPLIFYRGKKTLGRLAFKIGLVDKDNYSLRIGKFTLRFLILLFGEILLSVFTLCVPLIISLSMSAFSKKKQNFHDYMLGISEIDTYDSRIFIDAMDVKKGQTKETFKDFHLK